MPSEYELNAIRKRENNTKKRGFCKTTIKIFRLSNPSNQRITLIWSYFAGPRDGPNGATG
jgi:hypothetical protein